MQNRASGDVGAYKDELCAMIVAEKTLAAQRKRKEDDTTRWNKLNASQGREVEAQINGMQRRPLLA